jgi:nitroreductase
MSKPNILTDVPNLNYSETSNYSNPEEFTELVKSRRSCRVYTDEPIPEEVMQKCLDLALLAPNSSNLQPWEFYWVKSKEKREKLNHYCLDQATARTAPEMIVAVARRDTWKRSRQLMLKAFSEQKEIKVADSAISYYDKLVPLAYSQGPLGSFGMMKRIALSFMSISKPTPRQPKSISDMRVWANKSTALACENLMLAFRAHGYDTCPIEGLDQRRVRRLLELPYKAEVCMAISVGKRADTGIYGPRVRFDRDLFVKKV